MEPETFFNVLAPRNAYAQAAKLFIELGYGHHHVRPVYNQKKIKILRVTDPETSRPEATVLTT